MKRTALARRTRVKPVNRKRKAERFEAAFHSESRVKWLKAWPCVVRHCLGQPIEVAHVKSRGAGGTWRDTVPCCAYHHRLAADSMHAGIKTFEKRHRLDLTAKAAEFVERWENNDLAF